MAESASALRSSGFRHCRIGSASTENAPCPILVVILSEAQRNRGPQRPGPPRSDFRFLGGERQVFVVGVGTCFLLFWRNGCKSTNYMARKRRPLHRRCRASAARLDGQSPASLLHW